MGVLFCYAKLRGSSPCGVYVQRCKWRLLADVALNSVTLRAQLLEPTGFRPSHGLGGGAAHMKINGSLWVRVGSTALRPLTRRQRSRWRGREW